METLSMKGRDFIAEWDFTRHEIESIVELGLELKRQYAAGQTHENLKGKTFFMLFYNKSLRTRNSFEAGIYQLGGNGHYLTPEAVYMPAIEGDEVAFITERVSDVARVLSRMGHGIGIRVYGDLVGWVYPRGSEYIRDFAKWADIPVINMEDDLFHPCQEIADIMTMKEFIGPDLKGKKLCMSWAYSPSVKKPMAVAHSNVIGGTMMGMNVVLAHPKGFELDPRVIEKAKEYSALYGGSFDITHDMDEAFADADVVYPKSWPCIENLPPITKEPLHDKTKKLADENKHWICDENKMKLIKKTGIYMHCLPCDRGFEVANSVADGPQSVIFHQAENRLHGQKAIMNLVMR